MTSTFFVSLFVFCLLGVGGLALYYGLYGSHRVLEERFNDLAVRIRASQGVFDDDDQDENFGRVLFKWASAHVPAPDVDTPKGEKLQQTLLQAGFLGSATPHAFVVFRVMAMVGAAALGVVFATVLGKALSMVVLFGVLGALLGFIGPTVILQRRARSRQAAIARQLSDVLDLLVVCVESGLGLDQAILQVAKELEHAHPEISEEFGFVNLELKAGKRRVEALRNLAERTGVDDLKKLVAVLIQADRFGTGVAQSLRAHADFMRIQARQVAEEKAAKLGVKLIFPIFFCILPSLFVVTVGPVAMKIVRELIPMMNNI